MRINRNKSVSINNSALNQVSEESKPVASTQQSETQQTSSASTGAAIAKTEKNFLDLAAEIKRSKVSSQLGDVREKNAAESLNDGSSRRLDEVKNSFDKRSGKTEEKDTRSQKIKTSHKDGMTLREAVIKGSKYGDTFEGERANRRAGSGLYGSGSVAGGGQDKVSDESSSNAPTPYPNINSSGDVNSNKSPEAPMTQGDSAGTLSGMVSSKNMDKPKKDNVGVLPGKMTLPPGVRLRKPREDDAGAGGGGPNPLTDQDEAARKAVKTGGLAGGPDDGRGINEENSGGSRMTDKSVATHVLAADKEIKREQQSKISMEEMLKANRYTDPKRD